jgi:uncharacterized membrane-anchored protein
LSRFFTQHLLPVLPTLLLALTGITAGLFAFRYDVGSFTRMGPGFFPLVLGFILALLCMLILWRERPEADTRPAESRPFAWRPFCAVTAGILAWVLLAEATGFFIATFCQVVLTSLALPDPRWRSVIVMGSLLAIGGYLLFVVQLGVPLEAVG